MRLFEPTVMQFSLCNMPSTFQRMINDVLAEEKGSGHVEVYIDDILVHTPDIPSNHYWVGRVLSKLTEHQLYCQREKCLFEKEEVEFLGVMLRKGCAMISPKKVQAISDEKPLTTRKGLRRFLGLINYHRRFIQGYLL
jgi:hypothetical protein